MDILNILAQAQNIIGYLIMVLTGLIGIALMIPGEQPEKAMQSFVDFIKKFSKK